MYAAVSVAVRNARAVTTVKSIVGTIYRLYVTFWKKRDYVTAVPRKHTVTMSSASIFLKIFRTLPPPVAFWQSSLLKENALLMHSARLQQSRGVPLHGTDNSLFYPSDTSMPTASTANCVGVTVYSGLKYN